MELTCQINGKQVSAQIPADMMLLDFLRSQGCKSVKRGCETANCGLCTVWLDEQPVLSCAIPAIRVTGRSVTTLEGVQSQAKELGSFLAAQGAEQCGYCSPGFLMNILAMTRELTDPCDEQITHYLAGNLCRCSGYVGQLRAIKAYLAWKQEKEAKR